MWIDRKTYDDLRLDCVKHQTEARVVSEQNRALQTTCDWFRVRISQLERERAQLLFNYTGVKIEVPTIEKAPDPVDGHVLNQVPHFNDIGDDMAAKLGVSWAADGTLIYKQ